ncbi:MAG TPA: OsmC family protein [Steroidobacteraceae bacterium]
MHPIGPKLDRTKIVEATTVAQHILKAMQRVRAALARHPGAGIHADEPAAARWDEGMRVVTRHANGTQIATDMPAELGGEGNQVSPGWLLRAGLASCLATRIAMEAAVAGICLTRLEVIARSTSDARGLLGMTDDGGERVTPAPGEVQLEVRLGATDVARERLRAMIDSSFRCSPVSAALERAVPVGLHVDIEAN